MFKQNQFIRLESHKFKKWNRGKTNAGISIWKFKVQISKLLIFDWLMLIKQIA